MRNCSFLYVPLSLIFLRSDFSAFDFTGRHRRAGFFPRSINRREIYSPGRSLVFWPSGGGIGFHIQFGRAGGGGGGGEAFSQPHFKGGGHVTLIGLQPPASLKILAIWGTGARSGGGEGSLRGRDQPQSRASASNVDFLHRITFQGGVRNFLMSRAKTCDGKRLAPWTPQESFHLDRFCRLAGVPHEQIRRQAGAISAPFAGAQHRGSLLFFLCGRAGF